MFKTGKEIYVLATILIINMIQLPALKKMKQISLGTVLKSSLLKDSTDCICVLNVFTPYVVQVNVNENH